MSTSLIDNPVSVERLSSQVNEADKLVGEWEMLDLPFKDIPKLKLIKSMMHMYFEAFSIGVLLVTHPLMQIFGMILLNLKGEINIQSAYGIAITMRSLFCYSLILPMNDKLGIDLSRAFGARNLKLTRKLVLQGVFTSWLMVGVITGPIFLNSAWILQKVGVDADIAPIVQSVLTFLLISCFIEAITNALQTACFSQGIEDSFSLGAAIAFTAGSIVSYYLVVHRGFSINGWLIGKVVFDSINLVVAVWVLCERSNPMAWGSVPFGEFKTGLGEFIFISFKFAFSSYTESLGYEIGSIFVYKCPDVNQTAAYVNIATLFSLNYCFSEGVSTVIRTRMNMLLSVKRSETAKTFMNYSLFGAFLCWTLVGVALFFSRRHLSTLMAYYFEEMVAVYSLFLASDFMIAPTTTIVKSLGRVNFTIMLNIIFLVAVSFTSNYLITLIFKLRVIYNFTNIQFLCFLLNVICIVFALSLDWNKIEIEEEGKNPYTPLDERIHEQNGWIKK